MEDKELLYSDDFINVWSDDSDESNNDNRVTFDYNGTEIILVGFTNTYDKNNKLVLSYKIKEDPLRFLYYLHDESGLIALMAIKAMSLDEVNFIDMKDIIDHHSKIEETIKKGSVPLEL